MSLQQKVDFTKLEKYFGISWPGWINIIIWTPILVTLTFFMVRDLLLISEDYNQNNTAVQLDVISNETIERPSDMAVCIPYYSNHLLINLFRELTEKWKENEKKMESFTCSSNLCKAMQNHSWDVWNQIDRRDYSTKEEIYGHIATAIFKKVLNDSDENVLELAKSNFNWNQPIVDVVWHFLTCIFKLDLNISINPITYYFSDMTVTTQLKLCEGFNLTDIGWMKNEMIDNLYKRILDATKAYLFVTNSIGDAGSLTIWGHKLCIKLSPNPTAQSFQFISRNMLQPPPWKLQPRKFYDKFTVWEDATPLWVQHASYVGEILYSTTDSANIEQLSIEDVSLEYNAEHRVVDERTTTKCSPINTPAVCVAQKQLATVMGKCRCIPFAMRHLVSENQTNLQYCNIFAYSLCKEQLEGNKRLFWEECKNRCKNSFYKWKLDIINFIPNRSDLEFRISFSPKQKLFVQFTLTDKYSFSQYLSGVGGLANLYLGLSGLTVSFILLYCIKLIKRWYRLVKNSTLQQEQQHQGSVPIWHLLQMKLFISTLRNANDTQEQSNISEEVNCRNWTKMQQEQKETLQNCEKEMKTIRQLLQDTQTKTQFIEETFSMEMQIMKETFAVQMETIRNELAQRRVCRGTKK